MDQVKAIHVSNYFTDKAIDVEYPFTMMQALKLTYIAQGFHLSLTEEGVPFFQEDVFAWKHGPVIKDLYSELKEKHKNSYVIKERGSSDSSSLFGDLQKQILCVVYKEYGKLSGWDLSALTHKKGTPWEVTYSKSPDSIIPKDVIKKHFEKIITSLSFSVLLLQE